VWRAGRVTAQYRGFPARAEDIGYGVKCQIEDDRVSVVDNICEKILELEEFVQSCDIFTFNKV
jgi:translation elongation factor EF-1beta